MTNNKVRSIAAVLAVGIAAVLWFRVAPIMQDVYQHDWQGARATGTAYGKPTELPEGVSLRPGAAFVINPVPPEDIRYVAVGDSYTCGTGVKPQEAWPVVLTKELRTHGIKVELAANLGVNGWTTQNAIDQELPVYTAQKPAFATLMIGVNDTYRGGTVEAFRSQVTLLMDRMQEALPNKRHLIVVTIPDYSVVPEGGMFAHQKGALENIRLFNTVLREEAAKRQLPVADIYPLSQHMGKDGTLTAEDKLHPSPIEHTLWARLILPIAEKMLAEGKAP